MPRLRLLLAGLALVAAAAHGQGYVLFRDEQRAVRENGLLLGPFRVFPRFEIRDVGYDDNIYFASEGRADFTATLSPSARIYLPIGGVGLLRLTENPEYVYYRTETQYRAVFNSLGAEGRLFLFSRLAFNLSASHDRHWQRLSRELGPLAVSTSDRTGISLFYETPRRTALGIFRTTGDLHYEFDETLTSGEAWAFELDRRETTDGVELSYALSSASDLFLRAEATSYVFREAAAAWRNSRSVGLRGGLRFPVTGALQGRISLGYKEFRPEAGSRASFAGLVGDTEIRFKRRLYHLWALFSRDTVFSAWIDAFFFVDTRWVLGGGLYLSPSLRLDYSYDRGSSDYPEPFLVGDVAYRRRDRFSTHSLGLVYRIYKTVGFGLSLNSARWLSTLPDWDRSRTFVGASLTYDF